MDMNHDQVPGLEHVWRLWTRLNSEGWKDPIPETNYGQDKNEWYETTAT